MAKKKDKDKLKNKDIAKAKEKKKQAKAASALTDKVKADKKAGRRGGDVSESRAGAKAEKTPKKKDRQKEAGKKQAKATKAAKAAPKEAKAAKAADETIVRKAKKKSVPAKAAGAERGPKPAKTVKAEREPKPAKQAAETPDVEKRPAAATDTDITLSGVITLVYRDGLARLQEALKETDVSASQFEILALLSEDEPVTQQELARALFVSEGNITQMLAKMEKFGWIMRRRDWRTNYVTLTREGSRVKDEASLPYEEAAKKQFETLKPAEKNRLAALLQELIADDSADA